MMKRDVAALREHDQNNPVDVLIIGGGIAGAWAAYDAAGRGLSVALVEKNDWAAGTSSSSSKMIHGGLRYLENYEFGLVKHALKERKLLTRICPHQIRGLRFLIPVYKTDPVGRFKLKAGLVLYDMLAGRGQPVPGHTMLSRKAVIEEYPNIEPEGLVGGLTYGDCQEDDARMTLEVVDGAIRRGTAAANHMAATSLLRTGTAVTGATLQDQHNGEQFDVHAKLVINCAGPWGGQLVPSSAEKLRLVKGVHLLLPAMPMDDAMLITSPDDGRVIFVIPWYESTIVGTTDSDYQGDAKDLKVSDDEISYLLKIANRALDLNWQTSDVRGQYAGVRTLYNDPSKSATKASRDWLLTEPEAGVLMPVGGKYTTARDDAVTIINRACELLQHKARTITDKRPLPWAPLGDFEPWFNQMQQQLREVGLDESAALFASRRYGTRAEKLANIIQAKPELAARIVPHAPFTWADILFAARFEMVGSLVDVLRRRMPLMLLAKPSSAILGRAARMLQPYTNWDETRLAQEIAAVEEAYQ